MRLLSTPKVPGSPEQVIRIATVAFFIMLTVLVGFGVLAGLSVVSNVKSLVESEQKRNSQTRERLAEAYAEIRKIFEEELQAKLDTHASDAQTEHKHLEDNIANLLARPPRERQIIIERRNTTVTTRPPIVAATTTRPPTTVSPTPTTRHTTTTTCPKLPNERCKK